MKRLLIAAMGAVLPLSAALAEDDPKAVVQQAVAFFQAQESVETPALLGDEGTGTVQAEGGMEIPLNPFFSSSSASP